MGFFKRKTKTEALRKHQEIVGREIRDNNPKDDSEVVIRSIDRRLLGRLFKSKKDIEKKNKYSIIKMEAPDPWPPPSKVKGGKINDVE